MKQVAVAQALEQAEQAALDAIDAIRLAEARQTKSAALGAAGVRSEMEPEGARHMLLAFADAALEDRQVGKALNQRAVDPPHLASAVNAFAHLATTLVLAPFAEAAQVGSQ